MTAPEKVPAKWRPSLAALIGAVVVILVVLPLGALVGARVTSQQFVQETEANLHAQAAIYAESFAAVARRSGREWPGDPVPPALRETLAQTWHPVAPTLAPTRHSILPQRAAPLPAATNSLYAPITQALTPLAQAARKTTLVGFVAVDPDGVIIAASGDNEGSLAHVDEVARALRGEITSVARWRSDEDRNHRLNSISRDTRFRVSVARPVVLNDQIIGAVYLSRTPSNLNKYLFQQRHTLGWLLLGIALAATAIGLFLWRFLTRPLRQLRQQARAIADGKAETGLPSYGLRELASLGQSLLDMANALNRKTAAIETYTKHATHELKSPVTAIMGAAELLEGTKVTDTRRLTLARTIKSDAARMDRLLGKMRDMVHAQSMMEKGHATLAGLAHPMLEIRAPADINLPLPKEALMTCLGHMLDNAAQHGATQVTITWQDQTLWLEDNGTGISEANAPRILDPFFTTTREAGGTGMGLSICAEILAQHDARIIVGPSTTGAALGITFGGAALGSPTG